MRGTSSLVPSLAQRARVTELHLPGGFVIHAADEPSAPVAPRDDDAIARFGFHEGDWRTGRHPRMMADVNNDGRADIIGFGDTGAQVSLSTSTGDEAGFADPHLVFDDLSYSAGGWH